MTLEIFSTDTAFSDSPDVGHPKCLCSRCGERIRNNNEGAIRGWTEDRLLEYRFHYQCLGIEKSVDPDWYDEEYSEDYDIKDSMDLGACCCCRSTQNVINIVNLPYKTFISGTGWGNIVNGTPCDGAIAVLCDRCMNNFDEAKLQDFVCGYLSEKQRRPFSELAKEEFGLQENKNE